MEMNYIYAFSGSGDVLEGLDGVDVNQFSQSFAVSLAPVFDDSFYEGDSLQNLILMPLILM